MILDDLPLSRKQAVSIVEALQAPQLALWTGAVAAGKTVASLVAFLIAVAQHEDRGLVVMIGWTLQSIERNLIDPLQDEGIFGDLARQVHHTPGSGTAVILGQTVHLIGASDSRAEARIRGSTIALAYVDEVTLVPEAFWVMLLSRLRTARARLLGTTNPANPKHWLKTDYVDRAAEVGMRVFHFTLDDNPYLSAEFVERLKRQYQGIWYKRYILGAWVAAHGVIYDMFDPGRHVVDVLPVVKRWIGTGVDAGTVNPFAAEVLGLGTDRKLYIVAEWYWDSKLRQRQLSDVQYSAKLREFFASVRHPGSQLYGIRPERLIVDPSAANFIRQVHNDRHLFDGGVSVMGADNAVLDGIRLVSSLLATDRLLIHSSCKNLIDQKQSYSWDPKAAEKGEDKPKKENDHACLVAGTPVLTEAGWRPIEQVAAGDLVMTRRGLRPVLAAGMTSPAAPTVRVTLSDGRVLEGTGNHPVWVAGRGWERLDRLRYGDRMETCRSQRSSSIRESSSAATQSRRTGPIACTTRPVSRTSSAASAGSTRRSGRITTVSRFPKAGMSTTRTATRSTTTRPTWSAWTAKRTAITITTTGPSGAAPPGNSRTLRPSGRSPSPGIAARKAGRGTGSTPGMWRMPASPQPSTASSAASRTRRSTAATGRASAPTPASRRGGAMRASMTSTGRATSAAAATGLTSTARSRTAPVRVLRLAAGRGPVPVFNLSLPPDCPEYFAAGVLVHNCDAERYVLATTRAIWRNLIVPPEQPPNYEDTFGVAL